MPRLLQESSSVDIYHIYLLKWALLKSASNAGLVLIKGMDIEQVLKGFKMWGPLIKIQ